MHLINCKKISILSSRLFFQRGSVQTSLLQSNTAEKVMKIAEPLGLCMFFFQNKVVGLACNLNFFYL